MAGAFFYTLPHPEGQKRQGPWPETGAAETQREQSA